MFPCNSGAVLEEKKPEKENTNLFSVQISYGKWINSTLLILAVDDLHLSASVIV